MKRIEPFHPTDSSNELAAILLDHLGDDQLAADAVQDSLLKAIKAEPDLSDRENLLGWFYRILRNVLTDLYRRKAARERAMSAYTADFEAASEEVETFACQCLHGLLPAMEPGYAELIRRHDLGGAPQSKIAKELGITPNNLKVRLHRARSQLRNLLEKTCAVCATHGCLDCDCEPKN